MKFRILSVFLIVGLLFGCTRQRDSTKFGSRWDRFKPVSSETNTEEFVSEWGPAHSDDYELNFVDAPIPQPSEIPGAEGSSIPSLDQFKQAFGELAKIFQNVYFNTDDYVLRNAQYSQILDSIASYLKSHANTYISVAGHCDERGSEAYNLALGTRRSNYVRTMLVQKGVSPDKIHSISYGKEQPVDMAHNSDAWSHNRRVEFRIFEK